MKCPEARTRIPLLHSDELTVAEVTGLMEHIALCTACNELESKECAATMRVRAAMSTGVPDAPALPERSLLGGISSQWPLGAMAASLALCLGVLAHQGAFDDAPVLKQRVTLEPQQFEFGTAMWTTKGLVRSDRTPIVDLADLARLSRSTRTLDLQGITDVLESLVPEAIPDRDATVLEAARTRSPLADALVPCQEATLYEISAADAVTLGITVAQRSILTGVRLRGHAPETLTVVRSGDAVRVLSSRGPRCSFAHLSFATRHPSER